MTTERAEEGTRRVSGDGYGADKPHTTNVQAAWSHADWPGIPAGKPHGTPYERDETSDPIRYCWSCGGCHHARFVGCNGLRDDETGRCAAVLGEVQCARPLGHLGSHKADSQQMWVEWSIKETVDA